MSDDAYSVCQHCFEPTPGVYTVDGLVYCDDCYVLVAGPSAAEAQTSASSSGSESSSTTPRNTSRRLSAMSLRTSSKGNPKHTVFVSPPIPPPTPSQKPFSRPTPQPVPVHRRRMPIYKFEDVRVIHRGNTLQFSGAKIGTGVHDGLNALWANEHPAPPVGKYTWIGVYQRDQGDFIVASRISRTNGPGSGIAFRFSREKLVSFLKSAIGKADPAEAKIWQWVANSWTLRE